MEALLDGAIKILTSEIKSGMASDAALKITQSVLNLAHTKITLGMVKKD